MLTRIPATMATQHPDNSDRYVNIQQEPEEAVSALSPRDQGGLGIGEIMIDFEGKLTPYHQTGQIAMGLIERGIVPGRDVALTPRIPNDRKETLFRQLMSVMSLVETNILTCEQTGVQAIHEAVVPMIESGNEIFRIQQRIDSVIEMGNKNYDITFEPGSIRVIPLVESVPALVGIDKILDEYLSAARREGQQARDIRIMMARSDSGMSYGMVPSVLSVLLAISRSAAWGARHGVDVAPILGGGSLPFRGHVTEENLDAFCETFAGVRTVTIQSGLRYDHGPEATQRVCEHFERVLPDLAPRTFTEDDEAFMLECIGIFSRHYLESFVKLAPSVARIAPWIPKNRDRLAGAKTPMGYAREAADTEQIAALVQDEALQQELRALDTTVECAIPRAISYTASLYSIGMPPELLGTGRGLRDIRARFGPQAIDRLLRIYPQLAADLRVASRYVHLGVSRDIVDESVRRDYAEDLRLCAELIEGVSTGADRKDIYRTLLSSTMPIMLHIMGKQDDLFADDEEERTILDEWIRKMGRIRGSLG